MRATRHHVARTEPRAHTLAPEALRRLVAGERRATARARPQTRADCEGGPRPCPWAACRFHLALDVNSRTGAVKLNFPHLDPCDIPATCALDVPPAGLALEEVGRRLNLTRERVRQIEEAALEKLRGVWPDAARLLGWG